jgi:hypothetical protein
MDKSQIQERTKKLLEKAEKPKEDFDLLLVIVSSLYTFVVFSLVFGVFQNPQRNLQKDYRNSLNPIHP